MVRSKKRKSDEAPPNATFPFAGPEANHPLRREAETRIGAGTQAAHATPETLNRAIHELRIHQIELEMQNEELRRAQVELDVARARYFDLYDLAPIGYCTLSLSGVILETNLAAVTMMGVSRASASGRAFARFIHPEDQGVLHTLLTAARADAPRSVELRMIRYDGSMLWAHVAVSLAQNEAGGIERRVVLSDVTARRLAENGQHQLEVRYRELFSRALDGIVVCAADGAVENVNAAFCHMHGWEAAENPGKNLREFDTQGLALTPERMGRMLSGQVSVFQVEHRHRDGHALQLDASTSLIFVSGTPRLLGYYRLRPGQSASP
ncbi:MAG: PAS domain-containing protein [Archangium sp.]|nr:PAS domain-containing protein [Archangium sp.]MDP3569675.1 PAS domain-containing protein [Archangium sp.]